MGLGDNKLKVAQMTELAFDQVEIIIENVKRKKMQNYYPVFSPFPNIFSKYFLLNVVYTLDCIIKSQCVQYCVQNYVKKKKKKPVEENCKLVTSTKASS